MYKMELYNKFMFKHNAKGTTNPITHTRIGDKDLNIYAGSFSIPEEDLPEFYQLYKSYISKGNKEYLTEKQLEENGQMVVDLDFRYAYDVESKQHTEEHIQILLDSYFEEFKNYFIFDKQTTIPVWIMEKPNVNRLEDKLLTKDGIHIIFGLSVPYDIQLEIRENIIKKCKEDELIELPLINDWESVFDKGLSAGTCNWILFGSQKPANEAYQVINSYEVKYDECDGEFMFNPIEFAFNKDFEKISAQYKAPKYEFNSKYVKKTKTTFKPISQSPSPTSITQVYKLEQQKDKFLELLDVIGGNKKKVEHNDWFKIGSILKTNGYSKEEFENFTKQYVSNKEKELDNIWNKNIHTDQVYSIFGLQKIAKEYNLGAYNEWFIRHKQYIPIKVFGKGNNDIAKFISDKLKETLVYCNKNWVMYDNKTCLWRITDAPHSRVCSFIQYLIDCSLETLLYKKNKIEDGDEKEMLKKIETSYSINRIYMAENKQLSMIVKFLKDYLNDNDFFSKLDVNKYQVAYKNGILDLKTLNFKEGLSPSDMLTKTIPYNYEKGKEADIEKVRFELLKICNYNEEHLEYYLSTLGYAMTGDSIKLQEFYYIIGQKASNGKSVIFEALNDIIPCYSMKIESSSFEVKNSNLHKEIATWKGIRIGWINELTKNKQDAEIIKQVADGTSIKYKVMYGISDNMPITFKPFIISNHSPTIDSDEGIARRLKAFQMDSEFIEGLENENFKKCQFKRDSNFGTLLRTTYKFALMDLIYKYSKKFVDNGKLTAYPSEWIEIKKEMITNNNVFADFILERFEFGDDYEISEYSLKQYLKLNKFENIKFNDEVKKNKWNIKRIRDTKIWIGLKIKEL